MGSDRCLQSFVLVRIVHNRVIIMGSQRCYKSLVLVRIFRTDLHANAPQFCSQVLGLANLRRGEHRQHRICVKFMGSDRCLQSFILVRIVHNRVLIMGSKRCYKSFVLDHVIRTDLHASAPQFCSQVLGLANLRRGEHRQHRICVKFMGSDRCLQSFVLVRIVHNRVIIMGSQRCYKSLVLVRIFRTDLHANAPQFCSQVLGLANLRRGEHRQHRICVKFMGSDRCLQSFILVRIVHNRVVIMGSQRCFKSLALVRVHRTDLHAIAQQFSSQVLGLANLHRGERRQHRICVKIMGSDRCLQSFVLVRMSFLGNQRCLQSYVLVRIVHNHVTIVSIQRCLKSLVLVCVLRTDLHANAPQFSSQVLGLANLRRGELRQHRISVKFRGSDRCRKRIVLVRIQVRDLANLRRGELRQHHNSVNCASNQHRLESFVLTMLHAMAWQSHTIFASIH